MERFASDLAYPHLSSAQSSEVLTSLGTDISIQLHHHSAHTHPSYGDIKETARALNTHVSSARKYCY